MEIVRKRKTILKLKYSEGKFEIEIWRFKFHFFLFLQNYFIFLVKPKQNVVMVQNTTPKQNVVMVNNATYYGKFLAFLA